MPLSQKPAPPLPNFDGALFSHECKWGSSEPDQFNITPIPQMRGLNTELVEALATSGAVTKSTSIDSTYVKAHRSAHGGKGGRKIRLSDLRAAGKPPKSTSSPT